MFYRILVLVLVVLVIFWISRHAKKTGITGELVLSRLRKVLKLDFSKHAEGARDKTAGVLLTVRYITYYLTILQLGLLALSSLIPVLLTSSGMAGIPLLIHVLIAPYFSVTLAVYIILSASYYSFNKDDYIILIKKFNKERLSETKLSHQLFTAKVLFWIIALFSIPVIASILFSMYPLFNSENVEILIWVHKYSVIVLTISFVIHIFYSEFLNLEITESNKLSNSEE